MPAGFRGGPLYARSVQWRRIGQLHRPGHDTFETEPLARWNFRRPDSRDVRFARDSPVEGDGFELSVPRVMDGDLGRQVPALIAVFELAGTAVALTRGPKVVGGTIIPNFRKR
jgi:hypothetical protein